MGGRAREAGIDAGKWVVGAAEITGGKGGGRRELGLGKVGDPSKREAEVALLRTAIVDAMGNAA